MSRARRRTRRSRARRTRPCATTPVSREKPYLFVDAQGDYQVRVPSAHTNTSGISWANGMTPGRTIPLSDFFVATPSDSVQTINNQLARGKNLLLTPGVYDVAQSIDGQARGHGRARPRARDAHRGRRSDPADGRRRPGRDRRRRHDRRRHRRVAGAPARSARRTATRARRRTTRPTRRRSRTSTSASAGRTSARPTSRSRSTATTS